MRYLLNLHTTIFTSPSQLHRWVAVVSRLVVTQFTQTSVRCCCVRLLGFDNILAQEHLHCNASADEPSK